jgi:TonB family protein
MRTKRSWIERLGRKAGGLLPVVLLLSALTFADARKPVANPDPEYPEIARRMNITGVVKVEIVIAEDGSIKSMKVLGGHPLLVDAVQKALKKWKYAPAGSETTMQLDFKF